MAAISQFLQANSGTSQVCFFAPRDSFKHWAERIRQNIEKIVHPTPNTPKLRSYTQKVKGKVELSLTKQTFVISLYLM